MEIIDVTKHFKFPMSVHLHREKGIHVSNVIKLMQKDGLKSWKEYQLLPDNAQHAIDMRRENGFMWEELNSLVWKERWAVRPDSIELDGIWGSPDGIWEPEQLATFGIKSHEPVVCEMKWTSRSTKTEFDNWFATISQVKAYCKMLGVHSGIVVACHASGDYGWLKHTHDRDGKLLDKPISTPPEMCHRAMWLQFNEEELNLFWNTILETANANYETLMKMSDYESEE
jgi:hypothetical protein